MKLKESSSHLKFKYVFLNIEIIHHIVKSHTLFVLAHGVLITSIFLFLHSLISIISNHTHVLQTYFRLGYLSSSFESIFFIFIIIASISLFSYCSL
ncbi:MAG: hypothetical protein Q8S84_00750 [bacterium]|nr:hypothetical protein [bacterium]MDP3380110.1 hypothetical protein [bacterium]